MTTRRLLITIAILLTAATARADDWPAYRHDNRRSGSTTETLGLPLKQIWRYDSPSPPKPAWAGPAKWDAFAGKPGMKNMRDFDSVFHVTIAGDRVFFGSSADDAAHCLDAATGKTKWISHTDGPVRLPPAIAGGNAYFGSDDGYAYCVKVSDGSGVWKYHAAPSDRLVPSNGKLISLWPCRTGVLVSDGKAYFAGSLLPWRKSQFCAVDAQTGKDSGPGLFKTISSGEAMQGAPLASDTHIFVPQGRSVACVFSRSNGKFAYYLGQRRDGGVHATLMNSSHLILGPGSSTGWLSMMDIKTRKRINLFRGANRIAIGEKTGYIYKPGNLSAVNLGKQIKIREQIGKLTDKNRKLGGELKKLSKPPKGKKETPAQTDKRKKDQEKIKSEQKAN
ncbi:MAG: PQQ-binding-like beta-propeller repeat protein, partial [bacterium]|nr:PQQ-binding-like beta-propeller repeat protein [bacterium]